MAMAVCLTPDEDNPMWKLHYDEVAGIHSIRDKQKKVDDEEEAFRHKVEEQELHNNNNELKISTTEEKGESWHWS